MRRTSQTVLALVLATAGLSVPADAADSPPAGPGLSVPAPPQAPGYPSRDANLDALPGFRTPPPGYGEVPFWWWTGDPLDEERLIWQIEQLHAKGISGVQVNYAHEDSSGWPTYPARPPIFSQAWWRIWSRVARECRKRGMGIGLSTYTLDWTGADNLFRKLFYSKPHLNALRLSPLPRRRLQAGESATTAVGADLVAARAYRVEAGRLQAGGVDLMPHVRDGRLTWTAPQGEWELWLVRAERLAHTLNPLLDGVGKIVIRDFYQRFQDATPAKSHEGLNYFFNDELHLGAGKRGWGADFPAEFRKRKGYDVFDVLPALWTDLGPRTPKVRMDYADVLMAMTEQRYFQPIYRWHASRGLIFACDSGGRGLRPDEFGDYFRATRWYTAPGHDTPGGHADLIKGKVSSSIASLYRRPRVWLEGYHSLGWGATPERLMHATRENYLYGCTLLNLHGLYYTTHGGFWEWAPPSYHFRMPYWQHMGVFLKYFERLSYLMSQGVHRSDVAVLYPVSPYQAKMGGPEATKTAFAAGSRLFQTGRDFLFMDYESLARAKVRDGRLHVADASCRALLLPAMRAVRYSTIRQALRLFRAGGVVVALGALPEASDRAGRDDTRLDAAVKELFGLTASEASAGKRAGPQASPAGGVGFLLAGDPPTPRDLKRATKDRWVWSAEAKPRVYFKAVWPPAGLPAAAARGPYDVRVKCDNECTVYVNARQVARFASYTTGWGAKVDLKSGDVLTIDGRDHDAGNKTAGLFVHVTRGARCVLTEKDFRYTLAVPGTSWRTSRDVSTLRRPDPRNVHPAHKGLAQAVAAPAVPIDRLPALIDKSVARDFTPGAAPARAHHRKTGPRDVYLVMGAPRGSACTFRAKGKVELWDPWTGTTRPLRVLGETATETKVQLPLGDYEAQIVVFTPGRKHVDPPPPRASPVRTIALEGQWQFELQPTMDNRYGDFRLPAIDKIIGPEARIFRHAVETGDATAFSARGFDDRRWQRVTYGFGPGFWLLGPVAADATGDALDAKLAKLTRVDPRKAVDAGGKRLRWRPYCFSWRQGLEGDPGHQGYHGLKENVTDHFLCLGKPGRALNETTYLPELPGGRYYLWTSATVGRRTTARIVASAPQAGQRPHASKVLTPARVFVNAKPVADLRQAVSLRAGPNPILVRYDHAGRGFFVLRREPPKAAPKARTPLAMTWFDDPSVIRFDVHAGAGPAEWFRFTAPPGLRGLTVTARGTVEAWADGQPLRAAGPGRFEATAPLPRAAVVALRVVGETGFCGAAVFPEPIRLECGPGVAAPGDWSKTGAMACYSGGAWYRKTVTLTPAQARGEITLDLGKVVATAEVRVNGRRAGIRVAPPWRVDISKHVRIGKNRVEVLVFNTLANHYLTVPTRYRGDLTSGLIGPVTLDLAIPDDDR